MIEERWEEIPGFDDYAVSNLGGVLNMKFHREVRPVPLKSGPFKVILRHGGEDYQKYVHRLVAEVFLPGWRPGIRVRHIDNDYSNNAVDNLEYMLRDPDDPHYDTPRQHGVSVRVVETGEVFDSVAECAQHVGALKSNIYHVLRGDRKTAAGYTYEYLEE